ncbi:MAG: hypothetical protein OXL36_19250 [Bryobacterales bacterium]|nr:hypothetical protein [Bryobacterales bacterium]MDE0296533.1 hypothetical protein [Bryobacterales bacterium]
MQVNDGHVRLISSHRRHRVATTRRQEGSADDRSDRKQDSLVDDLFSIEVRASGCNEFLSFINTIEKVHLFA